MKNLTLVLLWIFILFNNSFLLAQSTVANVNWPQFIAKQDLVFTNTLPTNWTEGPFMGNGMLGAIIYAYPTNKAIKIEIGNSSYTDHRTDAMQPGGVPFSRPRLPIGYFVIRTVGNIINNQSSMRLDLYNAETKATIVTDKGTIALNAFVHSYKMMIIVEATTTGSEGGFTVEWKSQPAFSPRQQYGLDHHDGRNISNYLVNPPSTQGLSGNVNYCEQKLLSGGQATTAWTVVQQGNVKTLIINHTHTFPDNTSTTTAIQTISSIKQTDIAGIRASHENVWHAFYPQSYVTIPDAGLESFYWKQMYKLQSATRSDHPLIDDEGPWLEKTPWPYATWNLNVQLTYWPVYTANRSILGNSLLYTLWNNRLNLNNNIDATYRSGSYGVGRTTALDCANQVGIPGLSSAPEVGDLTWACHNLYMQYRHTMDKQLLRNQIYPLLKGSIHYYLEFLKTEGDGKLHLPATFSPEYPTIGSDANYDLALLKWGCKTLIDINTILALNDSELLQWKNVVNNLVAYPGSTDPNGYAIANNVPLSVSHRHFSHLLMIYPLFDINIENGGQAIIDRSLNHWIGMPSALKGYSYAGASSISAALGNGDNALKYLNQLTSGFTHLNTFYTEDDSIPTIETPLSAAQCVHDMLLQSWGDKIRIFPALPTSWADVAFDNLSAEGGFEVGAARANGKTTYIHIKSLFGEPCIVKTDMVQPDFGTKSYKTLQSGVYEFSLAINEEIIIRPKMGLATATITNISSDFKAPVMIESNSTNVNLTNNDFTIFPNPANREISLSVNSIVNQKATITIYNIIGAVMKVVPCSLAKGNQVIKINISNILTGQYQVRILFGNTAVTKALIINRL